MNNRTIWITTFIAASILMITTGMRQSLGLFVGPLNTSTGLGIVSISLAMAVGQFVWGAIQPVAGAFADRYGPRPVLLTGLVLLALGTLITPWMSSNVGLILSLGLLSAMGAGSCSFSVLLSASAQRLPAQARGTASGIINAGGSFGQFIFAPILQKLIQTLGWMGAMWSMAVITLLALPLVTRLTSDGHGATAAPTPEGGMKKAVSDALHNPSYLLLHLGFFTCGFHIAFLITHLPTEVGLCGLMPEVASWSLALIGLANIAGSLYAGSCVNKYRSKYVLAIMYGSRAVLVALYLAAPKTELTFYLFAAGLGFTWLATVPPTAAIVSKLFGLRYFATLFGLTLLSHQIGGFLGAYLGGLVLVSNGDYQWMWWADIALSGMAALVNLPIKEAVIVKPAMA
ncbi:MAG: MFS transporter [Limnohabitans sp.]|jgi:predicted MFS family arabinose efflux permease|nr:MFS transporter [Burkholderiales bacterium]